MQDFSLAGDANYCLSVSNRVHGDEVSVTLVVVFTLCMLLSARVFMSQYAFIVTVLFSPSNFAPSHIAWE